MRKHSRSLVAAIAAAATSGHWQAVAQTAKDRQLAAGHLANAKTAAGYEVADLYDHLCSRLMIGATLPFGRIVPPDNERDPARFHTEPVKVFDSLYYVGEKMQTGASPSSWAVVTSEGIILIDAMFN